MVICNDSNNPADALARGELTVTVKQAIAGTLEVIVVQTVTVSQADLARTTEEGKKANEPISQSQNQSQATIVF